MPQSTVYTEMFARLTFAPFALVNWQIVNKIIFHVFKQLC